ncbi:MAG: hypothetical protein GVY29_06985 [Spirochaetes bacterium]|jgi:hypothetical protein|nr:hypothetical protein [Spirochaetota bacterium]
MKARVKPTVPAAWNTVVVLSAVLVLSGCANTLIDQIAEDVLVEKAGGRPEIVSQVPAAGAEGVLSDTTIEVSFNMSLAEDAIEHIQISVGEDDPQPVAGSLTYVDDTNTLVFEPSAPLDVESRYTVTVSEELKNEGGASLGNAANWGFDTTLVNPGQFRFDIDMSNVDLDLSVYRTYLSVQPESSVSDSPLGGDFFGGEFGSRHSFLIDPDEVGASASDRLNVAVMLVPYEFSETGTGPLDTNFDTSADYVFWYAYQGSTGNSFPSVSQLNGVSVEYGQGGYPHGVAKSDPTYDVLEVPEDTTRADYLFDRGAVHELTPEDAYFRLDDQEIQSIAVPLTLGERQRVEVPDRYGFSAITFTSAGAGSYTFEYSTDSLNNRDTYSQLRLYERSGSNYTLLEINGESAVSQDHIPDYSQTYTGPDNEFYLQPQFDNPLEWLIDADSDSNNDTTVALSATTEYLLVVDSWLHLPADGSAQLDSGAFRIQVNAP